MPAAARTTQNRRRRLRSEQRWARCFPSAGARAHNRRKEGYRGKPSVALCSFTASSRREGNLRLPSVRSPPPPGGRETFGCPLFVHRLLPEGGKPSVAL